MNIFLLYFLISSTLFSFHIPACYSMEQSAQDAVVIKATEEPKKIKTVPSLKKIITLWLIDNPAGLEKLQTGWCKLNQELQAYVKKKIAKEKSLELETINDGESIKLSDIEQATFPIISPNEEYIAYIAQNRFSNNHFNWPNDKLVIIHIPTGQQDIVSCSDLGAMLTPEEHKIRGLNDNCEANAQLLFSDDSNSLFFKNPKPAITTGWHYHIPTKSLSSCSTSLIPAAPNLRETLNATGEIKASAKDSQIDLHNTQTNSLIKTITYNNTVGSAQFIKNNALLVSVKNYGEYWYNLLLTNLTTETYTIIARDVGLPYHMSTDAALLIGSQYTPDKRGKYQPNELFDCRKQQALTQYTESDKNLRWCNYTLSPRASFVLFDGVIRKNESEKIYPYIRHTHRALINHSDTGELATLLLAEYYYQNNDQTTAHQTALPLHSSTNQRMLDVIAKRYKQPSMGNSITNSCIVS